MSIYYYSVIDGILQETDDVKATALSCKHGDVIRKIYSELLKTPSTLKFVSDVPYIGDYDREDLTDELIDFSKTIYVINHTVKVYYIHKLIACSVAPLFPLCLEYESGRFIGKDDKIEVRYIFDTSGYTDMTDKLLFKDARDKDEGWLALKIAEETNWEDEYKVVYIPKEDT